MKKISILALTFILVALTLCACRNRNNTPASESTLAPTRNTTTATTNATVPSTAHTQPSTSRTEPTENSSIPNHTDGTGILEPTAENGTTVPEGRSRGIA